MTSQWSAAEWMDEMALTLNTKRTWFSGRVVGFGLLALALLVQPLVMISLPTVFASSNPANTIHTTDLKNWYMGETRSTGHNQLVANGLRVWTEGATSQDKAAGYYATPGLKLSDISSTSIEFTSYTEGRPGVQLGVDRDGNGSWDGYLVYEPWAYEDGKYWVNKDGFGVPSGAGYKSYGTLAEYQAANPDAKIMSIGYSLGSGVKGDATISKIMIGNTTYTFGMDFSKAVSLYFDRCDAITFKANGLNGYKADLSWQNGNYTRNISQDTDAWWSGPGKWTPWAKVVIKDQSGASVYETTTQTPCKNGEGYWASDYKSFGVRGIAGYPDNYSVAIMWDGGNITVKSMKDIKQYGWWSGGDRSGVKAFKYEIRDEKNVVRYSSPEYAANRLVAPTGLVWKTASGKTLANGELTNEQSGSAVWEPTTTTGIQGYVYKYWNDVPTSPYKMGNEYIVRTSARSLSGVFNQGDGTHYICVATVAGDGKESNCSPAIAIVYDSTAPAITVTDESVGDREAKLFSNVAFTIQDTYKVDYYVLNGKKFDLANSESSVITYDAIKAELVQGANKLEVYDVAGNKAVYDFNVDSVAPDADIAASEEGTTNEQVNVVLMTTEPVATPEGWTKVSDTEFTRVYRKNGQYNVIITDQAGNSTNIEFEVVGIDNKKPATPDDNPKPPVDGSGASPSTITPISPASLVATTPMIGTTGSFLNNAILNNQSETTSTPQVLAAEDNQQKTKVRDIADNMAVVAGDSTKSSWWQNLIGWWWLPLVVLAVAFLWWLIAAARRRRSDEA